MKINNEKISVLTVCYNAENVIERTIRSVLEQSYFNLEYIILDGNSKDTTFAIIKRVIHEYPNRNIIFKSEPDDGIYDAMNKAIKIASGKWVNIMNAGDTFTDNYVLEKIFDRNIPIDKSVLYTDNYFTLLDGRKVKVVNNLEKSVEGFNHQSVVYKRNLHFEYGFYLHRKKLIISDTIFLASIPDDQKLKIPDVIIANYAEGGASGIAWRQIYAQNLCANFIFKNIPFYKLFLKYYYVVIKEILLPKSLRKFIKSIFLLK